MAGFETTCMELSQKLNCVSMIHRGNLEADDLKK
jgi:hypothetical protein